MTTQKRNERNQKIKKMRDEGNSLRKIAKKFGLANTTIFNILNPLTKKQREYHRKYNKKYYKKLTSPEEKIKRAISLIESKGWKVTKE